MRKIIFILSALTFTISQIGNAASSCEDLEKKIPAMKKKFFSMIDYENNKADDVMKFEATVAEFTTCALGEMDSKESSSILIYSALMLKNNTQGYFYGYIPFSKLTKYKKYSAGNDPREENIARAERAYSLFQIAGVRNPEDRRIPGWTAGAKIAVEYWKTGTVSQETYRNMMREVESYPEFNLFTALLALSEVQLSREQEQELLVITKNMIDIKDSPCMQKNQDPICKNGANTPHNLQNSILMMDDVLLREAVHLRKTGASADREEAIKLAIQAKLANTLSFLPADLVSTMTWKKKGLITDRLKFSSAVIVSNKKAVPFWSKTWRRRAYQCSSCHSPNPDDILNLNQ